MPPEPSHWDRKDLFKEKKHERSDALVSVTRWKDSPYGSRDIVRWGSDDFRRPQGHGKQGGYQLFSEDSVYGCTISRSSERIGDDDDDICRPSASRAEVKYVRNNRELKGAHLWERERERETDASFSSSQRSVDDPLTYSSSSHLNFDTENSSWDQLNFKDHNHDKMGGGANGFSTGHNRSDKDHSLGSITWKPLKWTRSGSLTSRAGSGFSHSSSSRSIKADSDETRPEKVPPARLPSGGDASAIVSPVVPFEDSCARKKQRLGWGQGLAKYEKKQKVEGPEETISKGGLVSYSNNNNNNTTYGPVPSLSDKSPRVTGLSECASPTTPSSFACSSSPGVDDKPYCKVANIDNDMSNLSYSPAQGFQNCLEEFSASLENLEINPLNNLSSLLADLLQAEDASSGDSCFVRSTAMNKLLLLKNDILKAVEKTECEIDLFESELKMFKSESEIGGSCLRLRGSDSLLVAPKDCGEVCDASNILPKPAPLQVASSGDNLEEKPMLCNNTFEEVCARVGDEDIESPGTAISKCVEPVSMGNPDFSADLLKHEESSVDLVAARSTTAGVQSLSLSDEKMPAVVSGSEDASHLVDISTSAHVSCGLSSHDGTECKLHPSIFASNKDTARKAFEVFNKQLPSDQHQVDIWGASSSALCLQNRALVKEKLAARKCFLRFKERVLALKFRTFQHLWKEDMRLLSMRKSRPKSQKRFELSSRTSHAGHQKNRSSIRSRFTSPAGNLTLVPTTEILDFASKLLSDSQIKLYRNSLKMPALILDEKERKLSGFITTNGLVEDPFAVEKERSMINPWTSKEKEIFMEMLATFGKDFRKIASFLEHKTTADCIEFYYKNQKSESFEKINKRLELRKQGKSYPTNTYLVTSGKKWNREANAASLDMLGAASVIAAQADESMKAHQTSGEKFFSGGFHGYKTSRGDDAGLEDSSSVDIFVNEKEATAAGVLAGICGALSSEAMSSCVTSSVDPGEGFQEWKSQKQSYRNSRPLSPEVMLHVDDEETCSDDSCGELDSVDWTDDEKSIFIQALKTYGKDFAKISRCVGSRSRDQCRIFFSKARKCLDLDVIHPGPNNDGMPVSDTNGGGSDTEDACVVELESAICSTQSSARMDVDFPLDKDASAGTTKLQTDMDGSTEKKRMGQSEQVDSEKGLGTVVAEDVQALAVCCFDGDINQSMKQEEGKVSTAQGVTLANDANKVEVASSSEQHVRVHESPVLTVKKEHGKESTQTTIAPVNELASAGGTKGTEVSNLNSAVELHAEPCAAEHMMHSEGTQPAVSANGLDDRKHSKASADRKHSKASADTNNNTSTSCCFPSDSANSNASGTVEDRSIHPDCSLASNIQHKVSLELLSSVHKPQIISWPQKENCPVSASLELQDSSVVHTEDHTRQPTSSSSTLTVDDHGNKQRLRSSNTDIYHQYLLGQPLNRVDTSQILRGYPLRVLNKKEMNGEVDGKSSMVHGFSKMSRDQHSNGYFVQDLYHEECDGSTLPHGVAELPLLPRSQEQSTSDHHRHHSLSCSDAAEHSLGTGDVKLFGQILSPPLPLQKKPNPTSHRADDKRPSPETNGRSFNLKFTPDQGIDGASVMSKLNPTKYSGLDDFPMRSYGFWDGNRIQTGLSSLPDSAILLAKYPAAFGDIPTSSSRVEQQPLPPLVKRKDCVSVFQNKDVSGGGVLPDFQVYRTYDGMKVPQPFAVDMKHPDVFSEIRKRSGYEGVPTFQTQGRVVGMNVVGGGSILVGGNCAGVSDPVAAMQMHYATAGQTGSMREESWRRGDLGR